MLAGDEVSVGYLSRIERGERRPTLAVLATFAERLEISVDELLVNGDPAYVDEIRLGLNYAELALENGQALEAERQAREHTARAEEHGLLELVELGRYLLGRALEAGGDLDQAITELEALVVEDAVDPLNAIRAGIALSRCYRQVGDLDLAARVGERVGPWLERTGLNRTDEGVQLAMTVAMAHIESGNLSRAARICQEAVATAEEIASAQARSAAYWNSSIVHSERGELRVASNLAERALALLAEGKDARNLARLRLELGRLQLCFDPPRTTEALAHFQQAKVEFAWSSASAAEVAQGELLRAQALLLDGQYERAIDSVETFRAAQVEAPFLVAQAQVVLGDALRALGRLTQARACYVEGARVLRAVPGTDRTAAQLWFDLADAWGDLGEVDEANAALRHAAVTTGLRQRPRSAVTPSLR